MRYLTGLIVLACLGSGGAQSPRLDNSSSFFAGEWAATGENGSYCYLKLTPDGQGLVLIDGGTGDWLGARIRWLNDHQSVSVSQIIPLEAASQLRIMPIKHFSLSGGFNRCLKLSWSKTTTDFYLQRTDDSARQLKRAREVLHVLPSSGRPQ